MSPDAGHGRAESEIPAALERMLDRNVRHLPVCADGALGGTVSLRQLVRAASLGAGTPGRRALPRALENVNVAETRLSHIAPPADDSLRRHDDRAARGVALLRGRCGAC